MQIKPNYEFILNEDEMKVVAALLCQVAGNPVAYKLLDEIGDTINLDVESDKVQFHQYKDSYINYITIE